MNDCIFCKIVKKEIPSKLVYEDKDIVVFPDISPIKPVHLLVVPKVHIEDFGQIRDTELLGKIGVVIQRLIREQKLEDKGYRLVVNGGGAQVVPHLHFHLMGPMGKAVKM